jgi:hypothetical protein
MKNNRREFIKLTGIAGAGIVAGCSRQKGSTEGTQSTEPFPQTYRQSFNMSGYSAPKLETVRLAVIGLGTRGSEQVKKLSCVEGVEFKALCDLDSEKVARAVASLKGYSQNPDLYSGGEEEWKKICDRKDIDLIYISTPWSLHTSMAVYAMEHDKHVGVDRPAATTIEDSWRLVETSERTRKHCWLSTHACWGGMTAVTLNLVRKGFFGEIIHGEGCYIHNLLMANFSKTKYANQWRLRENASRRGNLYPDSGVDSVAQMMDINYGDKMEYLSALSSNDFMMGKKAQELAAEDDFWKQFIGMNYRGNMTITSIKTNKGRSMLILHDVTSPRPRPNFNDLISGTKGICMFSIPAVSVSDRKNDAYPFEMEWYSEQEINSLVEEHTPAMTRKFNELKAQAGNPINASIEEWRLIDCLRNGIPMDLDVYDAALYSSIGPLSGWSVDNRSDSVAVPDFTCGSWQTNKRGMDIELERGGGNTRFVKLT